MNALPFYREQANTLYGKKTNKELVAIIKEMQPDATSLSGLTKASLLNWIAVNLMDADEKNKKECEDCGCLFDHKGWPTLKYCEECDEERYEEEQEDEKKMEEWKKEHEPEREEDEIEEEIDEAEQSENEPDNIIPEWFMPEEAIIPEWIEEAEQSEDKPEEVVQPNQWIVKAIESLRYGPEWIVADYAQALEEIANLKATLQKYKDAGVVLKEHKGKVMVETSINDKEETVEEWAVKKAREIVGIKPKAKPQAKAKAKAKPNGDRLSALPDKIIVEMTANRWKINGESLQLQYDKNQNCWEALNCGLDNKSFETLNQGASWVCKQLGKASANAWAEFKGLTKDGKKISLLEPINADNYEWL